ncbi:hypothetical protein D9611_008246 [Ephemerocybe angulata]|uniref:Tetratricopeptide repeat protein 39B n=1 Tax=Ephemerocybe angulata TaxID=980116 RepID=A0A8H5F4Y6_9AGAR|nr:hypothetical protein D9611_008246 [Tulosesus angulatus]
MFTNLLHLNTSQEHKLGDVSEKSPATPSTVTSASTLGPDTPYESFPPTPATSTSLNSLGVQSSRTKNGSKSPSGKNTPRTALQSWESPYTSPPPVKKPYKPSQALEDIPGMEYALKLFLESHMLESEEYCSTNDEKRERLYFATGFSLIQCVKALMSYEDEDLLSALNHAKRGNLIASQHRKKQGLFGPLVSVIHSGGVGWIKSMTPVERHAELVYAESLFEKALLGIVYSGDWLAFIKEALNMRTTIGIYSQLLQYIEAMDAQSIARGTGPTDTSIDVHFRSGVYLGMGMSNIVLSLMPGKLMTLVELFGYHGDRKLGLELLMKAGGWKEDQDEPGVSAADEGLRRSICDMSLMIFHLIISSFTFEGVSIPMASNILSWNLRRYPNGVFFLFGAGRLSLIRSQPARAIEYYERAMGVQNQYKNLDHVSYWEIAICRLALWDVLGSEKCWRELVKEASWSKAIYAYGLAVCLLESAGEGQEGDEKRKEAAELMAKVPELRQRIAGKSIPLEKYVARKARKFSSQKTLTLSALELAYTFQSITHAPRRVILDRMLPEVDRTLSNLADFKDNMKGYEEVHGASSYHDDLCLARFLEGVCCRYVAYPEADSVESGLVPGAEDEASSVDEETRSGAEKRAEEAFLEVFANGPKIELDHQIVYHAHYEYGRLLACQGNIDKARAEFELVLSGKYLEVGPSGRKGKYSLENALHVRTHAANQALLSNRRL